VLIARTGIFPTERNIELLHLIGVEVDRKNPLLLITGAANLKIDFGPQYGHVEMQAILSGREAYAYKDLLGGTARGVRCHPLIKGLVG